MIPEKDIPELVEWLMSRREYVGGYEKPYDVDVGTDDPVSSAFYWWVEYGMEEDDRMINVLTAALEAFNERKSDDT